MNEDKYYAATGTKGYRWLESEVVRVTEKQNDIDTSYYDKMVEDAKKDIEKFGSYDWLVSDIQPEHASYLFSRKYNIYQPNLLITDELPF